MVVRPCCVSGPVSTQPRIGGSPRCRRFKLIDHKAHDHRRRSVRAQHHLLPGVGSAHGCACGCSPRGEHSSAPGKRAILGNPAGYPHQRNRKARRRMSSQSICSRLPPPTTNALSVARSQLPVVPADAKYRPIKMLSSTPPTTNASSITRSQLPAGLPTTEYRPIKMRRRRSEQLDLPTSSTWGDVDILAMVASPREAGPPHAP